MTTSAVCTSPAFSVLDAGLVRFQGFDTEEPHFVYPKPNGVTVDDIDFPLKHNLVTTDDF
ncbi:MAG: hypothetical protein AAFV45_04385 [Pseudomonadota bacterium]